MTHTVGQIAYLEPFELIDPSDTLITGKVTGDWTKTLFKDGAKVGSPPTITVAEVSGASGTYAPSFTPASAGEYRLALQITVSAKVYRFSEAFTVIAAAADGSALATAVAAVQTTANAINANVDVAVSTRATPGSYITTGSAVATNGKATIYKGDDQVAVASRSLDWSSTTADQWPDLTGATIRLSGQYRANAANTVSATGSVITPTGATKHVRFEFSRAATEALKDGVYEIQVIATLSGGQVITLVETTMTVKPRKGP